VWHSRLSSRAIAQRSTCKACARARVTLDSWDGYPAERAELADFLASRGKGNTLVWTGDIHNLYAGHLLAGSTRAAFEMSTGSVSSLGMGDVFQLGSVKLVEGLVRKANPHMTHLDLGHHMYVRVTLTREAAFFEAVSPHTVRRASSPFSVTQKAHVLRGSLEEK